MYRLRTWKVNDEGDVASGEDTFCEAVPVTRTMPWSKTVRRVRLGLDERGRGYRDRGRHRMIDTLHNDEFVFEHEVCRVRPVASRGTTPLAKIPNAILFSVLLIKPLSVTDVLIVRLV